MLLSAGKRLGPHEIVAPIGAGGMGEVYRARDTRLGRHVAIKVLRENLSRNAQLHERFEREARAISRLSHPHICTLYDIGQEDGLDYLVMEYLDGESLADRLIKSPLPRDEVMQYAVEITDALDTAHREGIIHRDLKPGNIVITKGGAKILDFGLAKIAATAAFAEDTSFNTQTKPLTTEGAILGTLNYMAPEQLEGNHADARTDIFAFGAILYEMVTGQKAFNGSSRPTVIAAILKDDPPHMSSLSPLAVPLLDRITRKCLEKDPEDRWQTARDLHDELKWASEADLTTAVSQQVVFRRKRRFSLAWTLAAVASLVAFTLAAFSFRDRPAASQPIRFQIRVPEGASGWPSTPVVSPNGRYIAFSGTEAGGENRLWLHSLDSLVSQPIARTEGAYFPFWSPDSRFIGFFTQDGKLKKVDLAGGPPESIADVGEFVSGGSWNQDGTILFAQVNASLRRAMAAGGEVAQAVPLNKTQGETEHSWPQFLPDGKHFLYYSNFTDASKSGIYVASLGSGEQPKRLLSNESNAAYAPPGLLIYRRQESVVAQPFDAVKLRVTGDPVLIADSVGGAAIRHVARLARPASMFSASQNGVFAFRPAGSLKVQLAWYDRAGHRLNSVGEPDIYGQITLSPDEKRLAVERLNAGKTTKNLWILDLSSNVFSRLTFSADTDPVWSPDGREILFASRRSGKPGLYRKGLNGGNETLVFESADSKFPEEWVPDGKSILYIDLGGRSILRLPLSEPRKPVTLLENDSFKDEPHVSPDGGWMAYNSNESGRSEVYVARFPKLTDKRQVSSNGGAQALWRKDGKELFYLSLDGKLMVVPIKMTSALETGVPKALFQTRLIVKPSSDQYCVTGDGSRFLFGEPVDEFTMPITVILNWPAAIKK